MLALYLKVSLTWVQPVHVQFPPTAMFPWIKWVCEIGNIGNHFGEIKLFLLQWEQSVYPPLSDFRGTKINSSLVAFLPSWWRWLSTGAKIDQVGNQSNPKHSIWKARNVGHWSEQESISEHWRFIHVGKAYATLSRRMGRLGLKHYRLNKT